MDYKNQIKTHDHGMVEGRTYYDIEEVYQEFKERLINELKVSSPDLSTYAIIVNFESCENCGTERRIEQGISCDMVCGVIDTSQESLWSPKIGG